ncbi:peptidase inhibitor family I36 protein [Streptomyces sp. NPDC048518]|uniref:peptidase inhibitor family I36 protein n=1 Tax=Streptomyces sp. NPDC048518 TaxID=3155029 RepID=UPI0034004201
MSPAVAEDTATVKTAKGAGACPAAHFCLYEHVNYNAAGPAKIWLFRTTDAYAEFNLKNRQSANKGRSAYNRTGKTAVIFDQWTPGASKSFVQMNPGAKLPSLNNLGPDEGAGVYVTSQNSMVEHTYHDAKYAKSLNLNDRARAIKIGGQAPLGTGPTRPDPSSAAPPETSLIGAITDPTLNTDTGTSAFAPAASAARP